MLYAWIGFLRPEADQIPPSVQQQATEFLSQPIIRIRAFGPLRDASGKRAGMMMIFEDESFEAAETFVKGSPILQAGLYEEYHLFEYVNEAG
jgi:uncharacterized protein YciI